MPLPFVSCKSQRAKHEEALGSSPRSKSVANHILAHAGLSDFRVGISSTNFSFNDDVPEFIFLVYIFGIMLIIYLSLEITKLL